MSAGGDVVRFQVRRPRLLDLQRLAFFALVPLLFPLVLVIVPDPALADPAAWLVVALVGSALSSS